MAASAVPRLASLECGSGPGMIRQVVLISEAQYINYIRGNAVGTRDVDWRVRELYEAPDLQPLWALVEKLEHEAGENEINALEADSLGLNEAAKNSDKRAKLLEAIASELRLTLEAMQ